MTLLQQVRAVLLPYLVLHAAIHLGVSKKISELKAAGGEFFRDFDFRMMIFIRKNVLEMCKNVIFPPAAG